MKWYLNLILSILVTSTLSIRSSLARNFLPSDHKSIIAYVDTVKGKVLLYKNQNILMQYASHKTPITNNIFIKTSPSSSIKLQFKNGASLKLAASSKAYISFAGQADNISVLLYQGKALLKDNRPGDKKVFLRSRGDNKAYSGSSLAMVVDKKRKRVFTKKGERIIRYGLNQKKKTFFTDKDLEKILTRQASREKVKAAELPLEDNQIAADQQEQNNDTDLENEMNQLFGADDNTPNKNTNNKYFYDDDNKKFKIDMDFLMRGTAYLGKPDESVDIDTTPLQLESRLALANKTIIATNTSITTSGWVEIGTRKKTYTKFGDLYKSRNEKRSYIELNEFFYLRNLDHGDLTIGKKIYKTGKGMIFSPSDRITPIDSVIPSDPIHFGNYLINYDHYFEKLTLSAVILPRFKFSKSPPTYNRWTVVPTGSNYKFTNETPDNLTKESIQTFFKAETTLDGWDLFLGLFNGANPDPVIRNDITTVTGTPEFTLVKEYIPVTNISAGFSTTFKSLEMHGEVLKQNAKDGKDDSYTIYMLGGFYSMDNWPKKIGIDKINLTLEFTKERIHKEQSYPFYVSSSSSSRLFQKSLLGSMQFQFSDRKSFQYDFHYDHAKDGKLDILSYHYQMNNAGKLSFKMEFFNGNDRSIYGTWKDNDNFSTEYNYTF